MVLTFVFARRYERLMQRVEEASRRRRGGVKEASPAAKSYSGHDDDKQHHLDLEHRHERATASHIALDPLGVDVHHISNVSLRFYSLEHSIFSPAFPAAQYLLTCNSSIETKVHVIAEKKKQR